jgi:hypothetical protein
MPFRSMRDSGVGGEPSWPPGAANQAPIRAETVRKDGQPRRRAKRLDVQITQQAMKAVNPTNQEIGPWQHQAARLLALAEKMQATGQYDPRIGEQAAALRAAVEERQRHLDSKIDSLPDKVADCSRVADTARALRSVASVLDKTLGIARAGAAVRS